MRPRAITLLFLLTCISSLSMKGQLWRALGGGMDRQVTCIAADPVSGVVYAGGQFHWAGGVFVDNLAVFDGHQWNAMGNGYGCYPFAGGYLLSAVEVNGNVLLSSGGVSCDLGYDKKYLHRWDGQQLHYDGRTNAHPVFSQLGDELIAHGGFDTLVDVPIERIGRWNGTSWEQFGDASWLAGVYVMSEAIQFQDQQYFAGNFEVNPDMHEIVLWDGDSFESVGGGLRGDSWVDCLAEYDGKLWVGGVFPEAAGNAGHNLMAWDGTSWSNPLYGVHYPVQVRDMVVVDGALYIAGDHYVYVNGVWKGPRWMARYDGQDFCSFGGTDIAAYRLEGWGDRLLVGCTWMGSPYPDTLKYLTEWVGGDQMDFCVPQYTTGSMPPVPPAPLMASLSPNPAQSVTALAWQQPGSAEVRVSVSDLLGRTLQTYEPGRLGAGGQHLDLALDGLAPGVYLVRIEAGRSNATLRLVKQ